MEIFEDRNYAVNGWHRRRMARIRDVMGPAPRDLPRQVRHERITVDDDHLRYVFLAEEKKRSQYCDHCRVSIVGIVVCMQKLRF